MYRTDDPVADYLAYDAERTRRLRKRPRCCECGEHIQENEAFYSDGRWMCEACMDGYEKRQIDEDEL